jgi:hypothetical protein
LWCKSFSVARWLAPLLIMHSYGFLSYVFCIFIINDVVISVIFYENKCLIPKTTKAISSISSNISNISNAVEVPLTKHRFCYGKHIIIRIIPSTKTVSKSKHMP